MPAAVAYGIWSLIREVVALGGSTMSSVDYFTTVLSKLAYAKNETQPLCRTLCVPSWLQRSVLGKKNPLAPRVLQCTALYSIKHRPRSNAAFDQTPQIEAKLPLNAALEKTPHLLEECGVYSRIIRKTSVQLGNLHHPDIYDSISAN